MIVSRLGLLLLLALLLPVRRAEAQSEAAAEPNPAAIAIPDSVRVPVGYQHWRGAALGAAIGGVIGLFAGALAGGAASCSDCSRQPSAGSGAVYGGLLLGGAGGVFGFLVGAASVKYQWVPRSEIP